MSLRTGRKLHRHIWTDLLITDEVIQRVSGLGESDGQPLMEEGGPIFEWSPGHTIMEDPNDEVDIDQIMEDIVNAEEEEERHDAPGAET